MASDTVATNVAGGTALVEHGAVLLRGWVLEIKVAIKSGGFTGSVNFGTEVEVTTRVYTSPSFDRWIDVPPDSVHHQRQDSATGRSEVWIHADAVVTHGHAALGANISPSMEYTDEPVTYPPWP